MEWIVVAVVFFKSTVLTIPLPYQFHIQGECYEALDAVKQTFFLKNQKDNAVFVCRQTGVRA